MLLEYLALTSLLQVGIYCAVQIGGGIAAAVTAAIMLGKSVSLEVTPGYSLLSACTCEFFYSFMLCFVVLNVAAAKKNKEEKNQYFALAIGFCVVAGAYGAGVVSGGAFNPAVAIALDITSLNRGFGSCLIYGIFELIGAAVAAFLFSKVRPTDFGAPLSPGNLVEQLLSNLGPDEIPRSKALQTVGKKFMDSSVALPAFRKDLLKALRWVLGSLHRGPHRLLQHPGRLQGSGIEHCLFIVCHALRFGRYLWTFQPCSQLRRFLLWSCQ